MSLPNFSLLKNFCKEWTMIKPIFISLIGWLLSGCTSSSNLSTLATVKSLDLDRYTGTWYEIARYENSFEKGCIGASALYTSKGDSIEVLNSCYNAAGEITAKAKGSAKVVPESGNAKLKVTFFWPFYGNY
jgi:apolipoprotein D and lipocalin family protein